MALEIRTDDIERMTTQINQRRVRKYRGDKAKMHFVERHLVGEEQTVSGKKAGLLRGIEVDVAQEIWRQAIVTESKFRQTLRIAERARQQMRRHVADLRQEFQFV